MAGVAKTKKAEKVFISEADEYLFAQGTHYDIYKKGFFFAVWAPQAEQLLFSGKFNYWS